MNHLNHTDLGETRDVYNLHIHTNAPANPGDPAVILLWDHVFVTDSPYEVYYYHNDYLGSVRRISDQNGNLVWSRDYRSAAEIPPKGNTKCRDYPFGEERIASGVGNDYKFTGKERDEELNLDYSWHRYYTYELGRFTQVDPLWQKYQGWSPYVYTFNNPLVYVDPNGEEGFRITFGGIGYAGISNGKYELAFNWDIDNGFQIWSSTGFGGNAMVNIPGGAFYTTIGGYTGEMKEGTSAYVIASTPGGMVAGSGSIPVDNKGSRLNLFDELYNAFSNGNVELNAGPSTSAIPRIVTGVQKSKLLFQWNPESTSMEYVDMGNQKGSAPADKTNYRLGIVPEELLKLEMSNK